MSVLSAQSIRRLCVDEEIYIPGHGISVIKNTMPLISPFQEKTVFNGKSFGLTCAGYDIRIAQDVVLYPGDFILASSIEYFNIPANVRGTLWNKSSWAREGLDQAQTILEPGWSGYLTLELKNSQPLWQVYGTPILGHKINNYFPISIPKGSPIAQITFEWLDEETDTPYKGKYQNQPNHPVSAIHEGINVA